MKKLISFFAFAVLMAATCVTATSCSDDDDKDGKPKEENKDEDSKMKELEGRWLTMQTRSASQTEWSDWNLAASGTIQFDENGTYNVYVGGVGSSSTKGTYKVDGKKITVTFADKSTQTMEIREMGKDGNSMEIVLYKGDGKTPDIYYRYSRCPKNTAEAKQMLMAQWKSPFDYKDIDEEYIDYSQGGKEYWFCHYRENLTSDNPDYKYRGKYICWNSEVYDVEIMPDRVDPTNVKVVWESPVTKDFGTMYYSRLCYQSFKWDDQGFVYTRVENPISYEVVGPEPK